MKSKIKLFISPNQVFPPWHIKLERMFLIWPKPYKQPVYLKLYFHSHSQVVLELSYFLPYHTSNTDYKLQEFTLASIISYCFQVAYSLSSPLSLLIQKVPSLSSPLSLLIQKVPNKCRGMEKKKMWHNTKNLREQAKKDYW